MPSQAGRLILVTGTKGLARHVALALTRAGAEVILAGYKRDEGEASIAKIQSSVPAAKIHLEDLDLTDLASVEVFAKRIRSKYQRLDVLFNNAGVIAVPQRQVTKHGFELHLGTNFLGHFALTAQLMPLLRKGQDPRVVTVGSLSGNNVSIDFNDLHSEAGYRPMTAYGRSKLAGLMFALELHRRSVAENWGISSIAVHPGLAADRADMKEGLAGASGARIGIVTRLLAPLLFQPAAKGILPLLFGITSPEAASGEYYGPDGIFEVRGFPKVAKISSTAKDLNTAERLWGVAKQLTNVDFDTLAATQI